MNQYLQISVKEGVRAWLVEIVGGGGKKMKVFCDLMEQHSKVLNEGRK